MLPLWLDWANLALNIGMVLVLIYRTRRIDQLIKELNRTRDHMDEQAQVSTVERNMILREIRKVSKRTQWMVGNYIADKLGVFRSEAQFKNGVENDVDGSG